MSISSLYQRYLGIVLKPCLACMLIMIATCLVRSLYKRVDKAKQPLSLPSPRPNSFLSFNYLFPNWRRNPQHDDSAQDDPPPPSPSRAKKRKMRYQKSARQAKLKRPVPAPAPATLDVDVKDPPGTKQPYEAFLVVDFEGTCMLGTDFNYPNEIIEFPVSLLEWTDRTEETTASVLKVKDEFKSFVKPTWRPTLSDFCTQLTGIRQEQVDASPPFAEVLVMLEAFLIKNGLIERATGNRLKRFCWCSDGPWDIRDFLVKQCFISQIEMPEWIRGDVLDVRSAVQQWKIGQTPAPKPHIYHAVRPSLNISAQLLALGLPAFEGRQHSGIDDTRNIARIVTELARRGVRLLPNTTIYPGRRWSWMGKHGQVLEAGLP
ncbi:hypothetical protein D9619_005972 [Psilocybe cf. subviscida]|uniref:Exonuclease domain-containing protein n=1 Tax=Psilocybe cf. subviscida TaxID=2480587 RepID=A0A8H5BXM8_9AGAR|nr:hypothetical protein D9619_005972 [Psilocybe cf. subviscida]